MKFIRIIKTLSFMIKKIVLFTFLFLTMYSLKAQDKTTVYFIPGLGTDYRIFTKMELGDNYEIKYLHYVTPKKNATMKEFAHTMAKQIDTTSKYVIIGASIGGMLATEMIEFMSPEKVILIASAKSRLEFPNLYRFQKSIPIQKIVSGEMIKKSTRFLQSKVEPDCKSGKGMYAEMLNEKDPVFMKRAVEMIINWDRVSYSKDIIHIHGDNDNTLPIRKISPDYIIKNGSHVMAYTRSKEISEIINLVLMAKEES
jgi:hypothetical protein